MELFLIYLITRLTDFKSGLSVVIWVSGILLLVVLALRVASELFTSAADKQKAAEEGEHEANVFIYRGLRRTTRRGLWMFTPVFLVAFGINMLLPTTRDALIIAGGYGLVEAVKNERVQRFFNKSAQVASTWLDDQLNGEESKAKDSTRSDTSASAASSGASAAPPK